MSPGDFAALTPQEETNLRGFGRFEHRLTDRLKVEGDLSYQHVGYYYSSSLAGKSWYDGGLGYVAAAPSSRLDATLQTTWDMFDWNQVIVGGTYNDSAMFRHNDETLNWRQPETNPTLTSYASWGHSTMTSVFLQDKLSPLKQFDLEYVRLLDLYFGGRYDMWEAHGVTWQTPTPFQPTLVRFYRDNPVRSENNFSPKFSLVYQPFDWVTLRGSVGTGFRAPSLNQLYSTSVISKTGPTGIRTTEADPNLRSEKMFGWEVGANLNLPTASNIGFTYFENYLRNLIYARTVISGTTSDLNRQDNLGRSYVKGVEATLRQKITDWLDVFGSLTKQDARITENAANPAMVGFMPGEVPRTMWSAGFEVNWGAWSGTLVYKYTGKFYSGSDSYNQQNTAHVMGTYDPYVLLNAKISYKVDDNLTLSVAGNNLLDERYYQYYLQPGLTVTTSASVKF